MKETGSTVPRCESGATISKKANKSYRDSLFRFLFFKPLVYRGFYWSFEPEKRLFRHSQRFK